MVTQTIHSIGMYSIFNHKNHFLFLNTIDILHVYTTNFYGAYDDGM